jgi:diguanylate cyclase (GGDEF)-like protein
LPFRAFESDLHDGRWVWMTETLLGNGWMLCVASDITSFHQDGRALRQAYDQALRTAQTDALTGLSNRTHIVRQADQLIAQGRPFALALLDLDHFKRINDLYGHSAGDEVIRDFARHLQASIRREDGAGRVGGEEFTLLLSGCGREQSEAIVSRLFARVRAARPLANAPGQGYTASAGLVLHQPGESATQLYNRADHALYRAKDAGRDQWAWAAAS